MGSTELPCQEELPKTEIMTLPSDYANLLAWVKADDDPRMFSEDTNPCVATIDKIRWMPDNVNAYPTVWGTDLDNVNNVHPEYDSGSMRFRNFGTAESSAPQVNPGNHLDYLTTEDVTSITPNPTCGDDWTFTARQYSFPTGCWTAFLVFKVNGYTSPYPDYSLVYPTTPASGRQGIGSCGLTVSSTLTDSGIKIVYNDQIQDPRLATVGRGALNVLDGSTIQTGTILIAEAVNTNVASCLWKNGALVGTSTALGVSNLSSTRWLTLGGGVTGYKSDDLTPHHQTDCNIYEGFFYNRALSKAERDALRVYLADKWGASIQIASVGPCATCGEAAGPLINIETTATYIGGRIWDSAILSGGTSPTGYIYFVLYDPTNSLVYSEAVAVSGNGTYSTSVGYSPTISGVYTWVATYSGDVGNPSIQTYIDEPQEKVTVTSIRRKVVQVTLIGAQ